MSLAAPTPTPVKDDRHESMIYSLVHDLRGPLRTIDGFAELLKMDCGEGLPEIGHQHLATIRASAFRMRGLIDGLLEYTQLISTPLEIQPVDFEAVTRLLTSDFAIRCPDPAIDGQISTMPEAKADPGMAKRLWFALLDNARKFAQTGSAPKIEVGARDHEGETAYFLRDHGIGFPAEDAERIFEPYCRLHRYDEYPGAGMGLAIARRIVERHGGRIWAESAEGAGATFFFTLGPG